MKTSQDKRISLLFSITVIHCFTNLEYHYTVRLSIFFILLHMNLELSLEGTFGLEILPLLKT